MVTRVERAARGLVRLATLAALAGAVAGVVLWWFTSGGDVDHGGRDTVVSLLVLALCLAPAGWLANVRLSLTALLELPSTLGGVASRRGAQVRGMGGTAGPGPLAPVPGKPLRSWAAVRSLRGALRDYGDVVGSWAVVAQVVTPTFWALTALALVAVPVLVAVAAVAALLDGLS